MAGRGIVIEIIGDATSYLRSAESTIAANTKLDSSFKSTAVSAKLSADAQIAAAIKAQEAQKASVAALGAAAARSPAGSKEQATALALQAEAQAKLNRQLGISTVGTDRFGSSTKTAERDLNKMSRGVLSGSGLLGRFSRSLAFASSGFIAFAIGADVIVSSIKDAESLAKAQDSLRVAIQHTGGDLGKLTPRYKAVAQAAAQFGVDQIQATQGLARATVLTGNAASAQRAYQEALVISKATGKDFNAVLIATSKGQAGITTSLRRYGVLVATNSTGQQQFNVVMKRFGGQAAANTTSIERLQAAFRNTLVTIGAQLLPTVEKLAGGFADWLTKMNKTGKIQKDVAEGMGLIHFAAIPVISSLKELTTVIGGLNSALGGLKNAQKAGGLKGLFAGIPSAGFDLLKKGLQTNLFPVQTLQSIFNRPGPPPFNLIRPTQFRLPSTQAGQQGPTFLPQFPPPGTPKASTIFGTAQPMKQFFQKFELTFKQQLAQVQASLTRSNKDDVAAARQQVARIKRLIDQGRLHGAALVQALGIEAQALSTIWSAEDATAQKRAAAAQAAKARAAAAFANLVDPLKLEVELLRAQASGGSTLPVLRALLASARKALAQAKGLKQQQQALQQIVSVQQQIKDATSQATVTFQVSAKLALRLARDQALGLDTTKDLLAMKKALLKFIATHKHNLAALTDAYNQLAALNQQLGATAQSALGLFKQASTKALTQGLGLTDAQRKALRARLSQLGPGGTVPGQGTGAFGFAIGSDGRPIVVHTHVNLDGKRVADNTTRHQQRRRRRNSSQRRGPSAGG